MSDYEITKSDNIDYNSWGNKIELFNVRFNDGVKIIQTKTFRGWYFDNVFIPDSIERIERSAFLNCSIKKLSIPKHIDTKGIFNHTDCSKIEKRKKVVEIPESKNISNDAGAEPSETDYKSLFLELAYIKELSEKDKVLDRIVEEDVKIPLAVYFFREYKSKKAEKYISDNFQKVMYYLVDKKDMDGMNAVMSIMNGKT